MTLLETLKPHLRLDSPWKKKSWESLEKMGLPTKKWDSFKYVSLKSLCESSFTPLIGKFLKEEEIIALSLQEAMRSYGALLHKSFTENLAAETNPFALLNAALSEEGQFIYLPPGKTVELTWDFSLNEGMRVPKMEVFVGKGASLILSIKCIGKGNYFYNPYLQLTLDVGANVVVNEHLEHSSDGFAMHTLRTRLKRDANLKFFTFSKGARCERHDLQVILSGENSAVDLKGLSLPSGKDEIHQFITIKHEAPNTCSSQHYKTALMGRSRSSFEGKIYVEKEAQKTKAYQLNNNLLLSPRAKAMSKPNLEIYADDVKASHGATCSQPKEDELFYLRSRGLSVNSAKWHLARGFCQELMKGEVVDRFLNIKGGDSV